MARYHDRVNFPTEHIKDLEILNDELNGMRWSFSSHCLESLELRVLDMESLLNFISVLKLDAEWIFEYYTREEEIVKVCYRVAYDLYDFILVLNNQKKIVTIYINSKDDEHETLNKDIYTK